MSFCIGAPEESNDIWGPQDIKLNIWGPAKKWWHGTHALKVTEWSPWASTIEKSVLRYLSKI